MVTSRQRISFVHSACGSKVNDFDLPLVVDQNVALLEVPMHDVLLLEEANSLNDAQTSL